VLRAGWGIYYNTTVAQTWNNFFRGNGVEVLNLNVTPTDPAAPAFTRGRVNPLTGARRPVTDVNAVAANFDDVKTYNYFFTIERELAANWGFSLTYQGTQGRDLPVRLNTNLRNTGTRLADGRTLWSATNRPDPRFGNIFISESIAESRYNGLLAVLNKRYSRGLSLQVSYQYSKSNGFFFADDFIGFGIFTSPTDPRTLSFDGGPGDFDMRHRFLLTGAWEPTIRGFNAMTRNLINGWMISSRVISQNGFSFNATTGGDQNGDTVLNDRPIGIPYNAFKLPNYTTVDFRLTRNFRFRERNRLEFIAEAFNVANVVNATNVQRVWGPNPTPNANFRTVTAAENARQFQLALRWSR
jgi:hypothetical protein